MDFHVCELLTGSPNGGQNVSLLPQNNNTFFSVKMISPTVCVGVRARGFVSVYVCVCVCLFGVCVCCKVNSA